MIGSFHKSGTDADELAAALVTSLVFTVLYHDLGPVALEDIVDVVKPETGEPVTVTDHNLPDHSAEDEVHQPEETRPDVAEDFVVRVRLLEELDLPSEVLFLVLVLGANAVVLRALLLFVCM